ncbi:MAG: AAA family ATPase [Roseiflexaceae bacterium]
MIPLTLKMRNFLSYRGETPLFDFRLLHIACISGENGAGKSSFLEAIHWALWGKARVDDTSELISRGEASMMVELIFEVNSIVYRVTRSFSSERRGASKLDLAQANDASLSTWTVLNGSGITETQQKITRDIVGMSYHIFQNSAYLRQGKADAFVQLTSSERREVIAEILEITKYDAYQQEAKHRRDQFNAAIQTLHGIISEDERQSLEIPEHQNALQQQEEHLTKAKAYKRYVESLEEYQHIQQYLVDLERQRQERTDRLTEHQQTLQTYTTQLAQRPQVEAEYAQYIASRDTVQSLEQLQQQVTPLIKERQALNNAIRDKRTTAEVTMAQLTAKIDAFDGMRQQHANLEEKLTALTTQLHDTADTATILDAQMQDFAMQQQHLSALQLTQQTIANDTIELQRLQQRISELQKDVTQYDDTANQLEQLTHAQERTNELDRLLGDYYAQDRGFARELEGLKQQADKLKQRRDTIQAGEPCPTCQTVMDDAHLSHAHTTFDQQLGELRTAYREVQAQHKAIRQQIEHAEEEKLQLTTTITQLPAVRKRMTHLETQKQRLADEIHAVSQVQERLTNADANQIATQIVTAKSTIAELDRQIQTLRDQLAVRKSNEQQAHDIRTQLTRIAAQSTERDAHEVQRDQLMTALATNQIGAEDIARIAEIDTHLAALNFDEHALTQARAELGAFGDIQATYTRLQGLEQTSTILNSTIEDINRELERINEDLQRRQQEQQRIKRTIDADASLFPPNERNLSIQQLQKQADVAVSSISDIVSRLSERLENAKKAELRLEENRRKLHAEEQQRQRFETLYQAFSNRGIQAMLINEFALPALEHEANRLLARMTDNQLYLSFKTSHVTKQGRNQEVLEIEVSDAVGTRPLEAFSGGEAFRISFALRIALSKLLAHRAGHRLETLIIDEGFGTQDAQGRERLVEAINSISEEFRTILVITHVSEVRDMFPTQIHIRRTSQTSQWEIMS